MTDRSRCAISGLAVAAVACTLVTAGSAAGQTLLGPTPYLSFADSPFAGTSFQYFHLENFESGSTQAPGLSASGGSITTPSLATDSVDGDDGVIDGLGRNGRSLLSAGVSSIDFSFSAAALGQLPTHAGVVWTDVGNVTSGNFAFGAVRFEAFDANGLSLGVIGPASVGDGDFRGQTPEDRFFGIVHLGGISRIRLSMDNSTDWELDHVQFGLIPSPGAAGVITLAGLTALRRRRSGR